MTDNERFEKWFIKKICDDETELKRGMLREYEDETVYYMWLAWQEAVRLERSKNWRDFL